MSYFTSFYNLCNTLRVDRLSCRFVMNTCKTLLHTQLHNPHTFRSHKVRVRLTILWHWVQKRTNCNLWTKEKGHFKQLKDCNKSPRRNWIAVFAKKLNKRQAKRRNFLFYPRLIFFCFALAIFLKRFNKLTQRRWLFKISLSSFSIIFNWQVWSWFRFCNILLWQYMYFSIIFRLVRAAKTN